MNHAEGVQQCIRIGQHEGCVIGWPDPIPRWAKGEHADYLGLWNRAHDPGWRNHWTGEPVPVYAGDSLVLDFKTSLSDKRADELKRWRKAQYALGTHRAYVCLEGVIEPHQVEDESGWGLFWLVDESFVCQKHPQRQGNCDWSGTVALIGTLLKREAHPGPAQSSKAGGGKQAKLTAKQHEQLRHVLGTPDAGLYRCIEIARHMGFDCNGKRAGTVANWIAEDALAGLIPGVEAHVEAGVTYLTATQTAKGAA